MSKKRVTRIDELAQSLPPPRDLWPAISAAIEADKAAGAVVSAPRRSRWLPAAGMAAAVALVSVGVFIGRSITPPPIQIVAGPPSTERSPEQTLAIAREENYRKERNVLLAEVEKRLAAMPEDERAKVSASLLTLRRSISEIEAQLGHDPANALLQELLVSSCQEEMRALTAVRDSGSQEI